MSTQHYHHNILTIDFQKSKTSKKLEWLAERIEGDFSDIFAQRSIYDCTVALGARVNEDGTLEPKYEGNCSYTFAQRFGVTYGEAECLFYANFNELGIANLSSFSGNMKDVTPLIAGQALRWLACRYEIAGN